MLTVAQPYISHGLWGGGDAHDYIYQTSRIEVVRLAFLVAPRAADMSVDKLVTNRWQIFRKSENTYQARSSSG
eukprot:3381915-Prymnesium_polylepis.1